MGDLIWIFYCYFQGIIHFCTKTSPFKCNLKQIGIISRKNCYCTQKSITFENIRYDTSNLPHSKCEACELYFLATLVALHSTLVSHCWAEFRTSVASRLASLLFSGIQSPNFWYPKFGISWTSPKAKPETTFFLQYPPKMVEFTCGCG